MRKTELNILERGRQAIELLANLFKGVRQAQDAGSNEGDEDVSEDLDATIRTFIMHFDTEQDCADFSSALYLE